MAIELDCCSCGAHLDVDEIGDSTVVVCSSCGKRQVIPSLDNESRLKSFNRATSFRKKGQFDEAQRIYETMASQFPEDFEVRWGLCLCRYGVEYIQDIDEKMIPICHRNLYESILTDEDYLFAISHCDGVSKEVMENDAKYIDQVQKRYQAIAKTEKPYDVFISYKETDSFTKERTPDSLIAEEIYDSLVKEGYNVFFSKITLEGCLGQEYEPNIEYALVTSKVMLLVSTSIENIESVWVKSEWQRYLKLMLKNRGNKTLIPCYANFDPYDLPSEIASFQAQDLTKVGAIKDIVRGVNKLIAPQVDKTQEALSSILATLKGGAGGGATTNSTASNFLRRAEIHISRNEIEEAKDALNNCLNADPENAKAYLLYALIQFNNYGKLEELDDFKNKKPDIKALYAKRVGYAKDRRLFNRDLAEGETPEEGVPDVTDYLRIVADKDILSGEINVIEGRRGFINTLTITPEELKEFVNYPTIETLKDFKTALEFADDNLMAEINAHLDVFNQNKEQFYQEVTDEFNEYVKKRKEIVEQYYKDTAFMQAKNQSFPNRLYALLALGTYRGAHEVALREANNYVETNFKDYHAFEVIEKCFPGEESYPLKAKINEKIIAYKDKLLCEIKDCQKSAIANCKPSFDFDQEASINHRVDELAKDIKGFNATCSKNRDPKIQDFPSELNTALANCQNAIDKEYKYGSDLAARRSPMSKATVIVSMVGAILAGLICALLAFNALNRGTMPYNNIYLPILFIAVPIGVMGATLGLMKKPWADDGIVRTIVAVVAPFGGAALGAFALSQPIMYTGITTLVASLFTNTFVFRLTIILLCAVPAVIMLLVELIRHKFRPLRPGYYVSQLFLLVYCAGIAVALLMLMQIFLGM